MNFIRACSPLSLSFIEFTCGLAFYFYWGILGQKECEQQELFLFLIERWDISKRNIQFWNFVNISKCTESLEYVSLENTSKLTSWSIKYILENIQIICVQLVFFFFFTKWWYLCGTNNQMRKQTIISSQRIPFSPFQLLFPKDNHYSAFKKFIYVDEQQILFYAFFLFKYVCEIHLHCYSYYSLILIAVL